MTQPIYVLGDVHGQLLKLVNLLRQESLIDPDALFMDRPAWTGGSATL